MFCSHLVKHRPEVEAYHLNLINLLIHSSSFLSPKLQLIVELTLPKILELFTPNLQVHLYYRGSGANMQRAKQELAQDMATGGFAAIS